MVRMRENKINREVSAPIFNQAAVKQFTEYGKTIRAVARGYNIDRLSLTRFVSRTRKVDEREKSKYATRKVFEGPEKTFLVDYLQRASGLHYELSRNTARYLVYNFGRRNKIQMPPT